MNILIIGGTGILSTSVVNACVNRKYKVTMINRGRRGAFINPSVELIKCDIRMKNQLDFLLNDRHFDAVIDFLCFNEEQIADSISIYGHRVKQYIFISSAQVYNTSLNKIFKEDDEKPQPLWSYSVNKYAAEKLVKELCTSNGIIYTIIRPGVNYDNTRIPYGIYPPMGQHWTLCNRILKDKPIITWNNGMNKLNLTRAEDFACGVVGLLDNEMAYNETFNVVGDYVYSWREVLEVVGQYLNHKVEFIDIPVDFYANELKYDNEALRGGRANNLVCSNEKLKKAYPEFHTQYDLESGIRLTLNYYKENGFFKGYSCSFDAETDRIINKYLSFMGKEKLALKYSPFGEIGTKESVRNRLKYYCIVNKEKSIINLLLRGKI